MKLPEQGNEKKEEIYIFLEILGLGRVEDYFAEITRIKLELETFQFQKEGVYQQLPIAKVGNDILLTTMSRDTPYLMSSWGVMISATKTPI